MISWRRLMPDPKSIVGFLMGTLRDEIAAETRARKLDMRELEARIARLERRLDGR